MFRFGPAPVKACLRQAAPRGDLGARADVPGKARYVGDSSETRLLTSDDSQIKGFSRSGRFRAAAKRGANSDSRWVSLGVQKLP